MRLHESQPFSIFLKFFSVQAHESSTVLQQILIINLISNFDDLINEIAVYFLSKSYSGFPVLIKRDIYKYAKYNIYDILISMNVEVEDFNYKNYVQRKNAGQNNHPILNDD